MKKQQIRKLEGIQNILGAAVLAGLTFMVIHYYRESYKTDKSVERINEIVAGEDKVIDSNESYLALMAIQCPNLEQDNPIRSDKDRIYFERNINNPAGNTIKISVGTEPPRTRWSDSRCMGYMHRDGLEYLIRNKFGHK